MWVAGLLLIALMVGMSLSSPPPPVSAAERAEASAAVMQPKDRLFDALCIGVVVLTMALYVVFF
jgi:hypothetical protein